MGASQLWTSFMEHDSTWTKIAAAVVAGAVGVWSWATNKPDPETGKKSMLKSVVTLGALGTGTALGITSLTKTSIRQTFRTVKENGWEGLHDTNKKKPDNSSGQSL